MTKVERKVQGVRLEENIFLPCVQCTDIICTCVLFIFTFRNVRQKALIKKLLYYNLRYLWMRFNGIKAT